MSDIKFKDGDLVYCPMATNEILTVSDKRNVAYEGTDGEISTIGVYYDGKYSSQHHNLAIFPATQEWYEKLVRVYPNLEAPPPPKKSSMDVIKAMLDDGYYRIPCYVSVINEEPNDEMCIDLLFDIDDSGSSSTPCRCVGGKWKYARPFDVKTGRVIVDYVDGQAVLED